jgi:hypothetical protein
MSGSRSPQFTTPPEWGQTPARAQVPADLSRDPSRPLPSIERGALVVLRQFDIANEVQLDKVQAMLASQRSPLSKKSAQPVVFSNPPVAVPLGSQSIELGGRPTRAELVARVFDFGAVSVRMRIGLAPGTSWAEMAALVRAAQVDEGLTKIAQEAVRKLVERIAPALQGAHESQLFEDYVVVDVERFDPPTPPTALRLDAVARLLLGERDDAQLAPSELEEATRNRSSYYDEDLCVAGWSTALVVEPKGDTDPIDVLELANAQLLELRYYDQLLDQSLNQLYDEVGERQGKWFALLRNYGPVLRRAMAVLLEIAEFIERVENTLKIIGDVYLARLYASAVDSLRIAAWERAVTRKQALVQQVYDVLKSEVDASRDQLLELTIVLLIIGEILLALGHVTG